ncbi:MAG TPA: homocysteine S-methyltransferase family protein, partial [Candidatus Binatia bacterium]|nr:homocysteine S-methyltransferase family protein [Candidatus Binatia bacterium]
MQSTAEKLKDLLSRRILVIDGAIGTMIQALKLDEADFRGAEFKNHSRPLKGCNDLLSLTRPDAIENIHKQFLAAGADIVESNSFNSQAISLADYALEDHVYAINLAAAQCARRAADAMTASTPEKPRFVAGAIGPTNRTASLSPDVNNPAFRATDFDTLVAAYSEQVRGLVDGGVDLLLPETTFDTLNLKACLFAIEQFFRENNIRLPVFASITITDRSGRTLSGQTLEACLTSIAHFPLAAVGLNCALGPAQMVPFIADMARLAPLPVFAYPNAGLPNEFGGYDMGPEEFAKYFSEWAREGWLNLAGGCCGTTPNHIAAVAKAVAGVKPRVPPER